MRSKPGEYYTLPMLFLAWLNEVRKELTALITGSLLLFGLGLYQSTTDKHVPGWMYFGIVVGFLGWAFFGAWAKQHKKLEAFLNPDIRFNVQPKDKLQRDEAGWDAIYGRIAVTNISNVMAKDCRFVIESWNFSVPGLNEDTALTIKDEKEPITDIPPHDTKQFNLFATVLTRGTDNVEYALVYAPNYPKIDSVTGGYQMAFRLTGSNIDTRRYRALLVMSAQKNIKITRIDEISFENTMQHLS